MDLILGHFVRESASAMVSAIALPILFIGFGLVTLGVLMCLDMLECLLHTLRLHWYVTIVTIVIVSIVDILLGWSSRVNSLKEMVSSLLHLRFR